MTPCVITDGPVAYGFSSKSPEKPVCVGCEWGPKSTGVPRPKDWDKQVAKYLAEERQRDAKRERKVRGVL
jgi:hypothetical protein